MLTTLGFHEVADVFPLMEGAEFEVFKQDIATHGLKEPIWVYDNKIIDGRNRYRACQELGIDPEIRDWPGDGDLTSFVVSLNLRRRHLTESQRAIIAARLKPKFEKEAKRRQRASQFGGDSDTVRANLPAPKGPEKARARERVAELFNVSPRSVEAASKVLKNGTPELVRSVDRDDVKVSAAATVAGLPPVQQQEVISRGPGEVRKKAKEIRAEKRRQCPLHVAMQQLFSVLGTVDAPKGKHTEGWGGFGGVIRDISHKERQDVREQLLHVIERLQGWVSQIERLEKEVT